MSDSEALRDRAQDLSQSASSCRERLLAQAETAARLRSQVEALRKNLAVPRDGAPARREAATGSARNAASSLRAAAFTAPPRPAASSARWAPYAVIVVAAIGFEFARTPRVAALPLDGLVRPAVSASPVGAASRAPGTPVAFDEDDRGAEALALVHAWKLPGDEETLLERLGDADGLPYARPAWSAHRSGADAYLVIYQRDESFPAYQFEADLAAKTVTPSPGTEAALLAPSLAFSER